MCLLFVGGARCSDVVFEITEASLNSMAKAYVPRLKFSSLLPGYSTSSIKQFLPGAYKKCPGCLINAQVTVQEFPPTVSLDTGDTVLHGHNLIVNLTAVNTNKEHFPLLMFLVNGSAITDFGKQITTGPNAGRIPATVKITETSTDLLASYIGDIPPNPFFNVIVKAITTNIIAPQFNKNFPGIYFPKVEGVTLTEMVIQNLKNNVLTVPATIAFDDDLADDLERRRLLIEEARRRLTSALADGVAGVNMAVEQTGLQKAVDNFSPYLSQQLNSIGVPDISGGFSAAGTSFRYSVEGIKLRGFSFSKSSSSFKAESGPVLSLSGIALNIPSSSFTIKKHMYVTWLSCSGTVTASLSNAAVDVVLNVTSTGDGRPVMSPHSSWDFGSLSVSHTMDGVACKAMSAIASLFDAKVNDKIKSVIKSAVPTETDKVVASYASGLMQQLSPSKVSFDEGVNLDLSLVQNPSTSDSDLEFNFAGIFSSAMGKEFESDEYYRPF